MKRKFKTLNQKLYLITTLASLLATAQPGTFAEPSALYETGASALDKAPIATIKVSMQPIVNISPLLYGVAYDWDVNPSQTFAGWQQAMQNVAHYRMAQFGGGWNAEHYEWGKINARHNARVIAVTIRQSSQLEWIPLFL